MSHIVILTGAGISAESGMKTFRDNNGLWENERVEDVATPEAFAADPERVYRFYNERRHTLFSGDVAPNAAHHALARLEKEHSGLVTLITQNVDDLHQRAGSENLITMHGELSKARCCQSGHVTTFDGEFSDQNRCECCQPSQPLRPHIVWFGEVPLQLDDIYDAVWRCDVFVAIGTSGQVYPAAGLVAEAKRNGAATIELNLEATSGEFDEHRQGPASVIVPQWVEELLEQGAHNE